MHCFTAAFSVSGFRTSTEANVHLRPVAAMSSLAAASPLSALREAERNHEYHTVFEEEHHALPTEDERVGAMLHLHMSVDQA